MQVLPPARGRNAYELQQRSLYAPAVLITVVENAERPARDVIVTE